MTEWPPRFEDGTIQSHCWVCGHAHHAARAMDITRCRCCYRKDTPRGGRVAPDGTICPLDVAD